MRILQTPPRFFPYVGGVEQVVLYLSRELAKRGHSVEVVCANEPAVGNGIIEGITVKRLAYCGKIGNTNITFSLPYELKRRDFDLIHTHLPTPWSADWSAIFSRIKNKPLFLSYYNDISGSGVNKIIANFYNATALKFLLKRAHRIFINQENYLNTSPFLKSFKDKIIVVPLGVDTAKFHPANVNKNNNEKIIFFLSILDRFHTYKGLDCLFSALKNVIPTTPVKLYIGGFGQLSDFYKNLAKETGLENNVIFLGRLSDEELLYYYSLCNFFVLPSVSSTQEGFGLVALEAMACCRPVVISDIVGVADSVRKENAGIVVKPNDSQELSQALKHLLLNEKECEQMGKNAYRLASAKYALHNYIDAVEKEYLTI